MISTAPIAARVHRRIRGLHARARHRLGLPANHPGRASLLQGFRHPVDAARRSLLTQKYREIFGNATTLELLEADRLSAHRFTILGHTTEHGEEIAWSRDPVSGRDWPRSYSQDIAYRGPGRLGDIKLPWELNKHQYFFTLGKTAWLTGNAAPAVDIVRQIDHWITDNPCHTGIHWISALETGTRAISWIMAYPFYADWCGADFKHRLATSLAQHLLFVEQHLSTGRFANTHLVGEAAALVTGALFLDSSHSARWLAKGLRILDEEIERQVSGDGGHVERSVAYHRFFLDHYYLVAALLHANGQSLPSVTLDRMESMTTFLMHMLLPDGTAPAFGDGDDARGVWVRADAPADYRGLLALGAVLFERGDFKAVSGGPAEEVLWLLGIEGVAAFEAVASRQPEQTSVACAETGYFVMRGGWGPQDPVVVFDCGSLGFGPAGHGHADALSIQLHASGYPFFIDSGTFSYNLDYAWRDDFRGTRAHNCIVLDRENQSVPGDRMSWKSIAVAHPREWITTPWFDLVDGEHDGYHRLSDPVAHRRVVIFLKPDVWLIWDDLHGAARHDLELLLHVQPDCVVTADAGAERFILTSPQGARLNAWVTTEGVDGPKLTVTPGNDQERPAWFSPHYGTRVPSRMLSVTGGFTGRCGLLTSLSTSVRTRPEVVLTDAGLSVRLSSGEGVEATVCYREPGRSGSGPEIDGVRFDGALLFHRRAAGRSDAVWASRFQELSIDGLVEVRAQTTIDSLVLAQDRCEIQLNANGAHLPDVRLPEGIRLTVNGRLHPTGSTPVTCQ